MCFVICLTLDSYGKTRIIFFKGKISLNSKKVSKSNFKKLSLKKNDVIKVGPASIAIIKFDQTATVKLAENSTLKIINPKVSTKPISIVLTSGSLFSKIIQKALLGATNFEVRAKSTVMGVRGTEFFTAFSQEDKSKDLWMCVNSGEVSVMTSKSKEIFVKAGEGVFIKNGTNASKPKKYAWTQKLNWNMNPKSGELKNSAMKELYMDLLDQDYD
jgi:hypothetical protein